MDLVEKVKTKYNLNDDEAKDFIDSAKGFFYLLRYPSEPTADETTRPINTFVEEQAVLRICDEIAQRNGFNSSVGYKENGVSFDCDAAWLSERLTGLIKPTVTVL